MPVATFRTGTGSLASLTAGTSIDNVFANSQWEILTGPCEIFIGIVADGGAIGDVLATCYSGTDTLAEEQPVSNANRFPIYPDDYTLNDVAAAGDRLKLKLRNPSASTRVVTIVLRINPL